MNIESAIKAYTPSDATINLVRQANFLLIAGVVSAGKDTVITELVKDDRYRRIVSHTTRAPRENHGLLEVNGEDYHFVSPEEAAQLVEKKAFVEVKYVHGNIYGTSAAELQRITDSGKIATTDIDIQGVVEYLELKQDTKAIFLLPPSVDTWLARLEKRYGSSERHAGEIATRFKTAYEEVQFIKSDPRFILVINDDLATTVDRVQKIMDGERSQTSEFAQAVTNHLLEFLQSKI